MTHNNTTVFCCLMDLKQHLTYAIHHPHHLPVTRSAYTLRHFQTHDVMYRKCTIFLVFRNMCGAVLQDTIYNVHHLLFFHALISLIFQLNDSLSFPLIRPLFSAGVHMLFPLCFHPLTLSFIMSH